MQFRKCVKYFLTFMDRQSLALVRENFHGFSFYFNFKVFNVKTQFFLPFLESIISEKNHLLEKHPKTDIGVMEKVSVVRDIKSFMETKDFQKMNFFRWFTWKKRNICLIYSFILQKFSQKWSKIVKENGHQQDLRSQMSGFSSLQQHIPRGF